MGELLNIFDHYKWTEEEVAAAWEHAWDFELSVIKRHREKGVRDGRNNI
jgi:hypothetical protein